MEIIILILTVAGLYSINYGFRRARRKLNSGIVALEIPVYAVALLILLIVRSESEVVVGVLEREPERICVLYEVVIDVQHKGAY